MRNYLTVTTRPWAVLGTALLAFISVLCSCDRQKVDTGSVPIKIGAILPLTGSAAELAGQHKRGLELGVAEVNRLGGVEGRRFELAIEDDQNDPKTTVSAFRKLVTTDKIQVAVTVMSGPSMAVAPIGDEEATVLFANCGHSEVTRLHKYVFRNFPSSNLEVRRMAKFAASTLKLKSIWMLYIDDAYGQGARDLALKQFPLGSIQVFGTDAYGKAGTDIRPALVRVAGASPDAVYVYGYGQATADAVNQLREVGYKGLLLGSYNFSQPPLTTVSKDGIEGSYYTVPRFNYEDTDQGKQFLRLYQEKYNSAPLWNGAIEYDAVMIVRRALEIGAQEKLSLQSALEKVGDFAGAAGTYEYDATTKDWLTPMSIAHILGGTVEYHK